MHTAFSVCRMHSLYLFIYLLINQSTSNTVYKITQLKRDKTNVWIEWPIKGRATSVQPKTLLNTQLSSLCHSVRHYYQSFPSIPEEKSTCLNSFMNSWIFPARAIETGRRFQSKITRIGKKCARTETRGYIAYSALSWRRVTLCLCIRHNVVVGYLMS